jgi:hypothetical protein
MEMPAVQPLSASVSNHWSTTKKRKTTGNRRTWPSSGELLQTNGIEPTTQHKARPSLLLYKEGTLALLIAGRHRRGEGRGQPALDLEENGERGWGRDEGERSVPL